MIDKASLEYTYSIIETVKFVLANRSRQQI